MLLQRYQNLAVAVTGASGFLGRLLCTRLMELGASVTSLVRPEGRPAPAGTRSLTVDLNGSKLKETLEEAAPGLVFHLAGCLDRSLTPRAWAGCRQTNLEATLNLLECLPGRPLVVAGSCDEYGGGDPPLSEESPLRPRTPYGASKAAAWTLARVAAPSLGVSVRWARIFLLYGPGQAPGPFLADLLAAARSGRALRMTGGRQTRDFTWAPDAVEALLRLGLLPGEECRAFNVCTGIETSLLEAVDLVGHVSGRRVELAPEVLPYRPEEVFRLFGRPDRLREATGYAPTTSLEEGLRNLLA